MAHITSDDEHKFVGSPYLHDFGLRLNHSHVSADIDDTVLRTFVNRAFGEDHASSAKDKAHTALDYYARLAKEYGAYFPEQTLSQLTSEVGDVSRPPLADEAIDEIPNAPVVLAVLDEGIPFLAQTTRRANNQSRFASVWMQSAQGSSKTGKQQPPFGRQLDHRKIQQVIRTGADEDTAYRSIGAIDWNIPTQQRLARRSTHGAAVLGLANGTVDDSHLLMGVCFPPNAVRDTSGSLLPFFILMGICYCIERTRAIAEQLKLSDPGRFDALTIPLVFNLSYGVLAGPKDGSGILESFMEELSQLPCDAIRCIGDIKFVLPMGNGRQSQTSAKLGGDHDRVVSFRTVPDDLTPSFVEIWSTQISQEVPAGPQLALNVTPPQSEVGQTIQLTSFETYQDVEFACGFGMRAYSSLRKVKNGYRELLLLSFHPTCGMPASSVTGAGDWAIGLPRSSETPIKLYVQRDESLFYLKSGGQQARFHHPDYRTYDDLGRQVIDDQENSSCPVMRELTVNAFANSPSILKVGGSVKRNNTLSPYSAKGAKGAASPPNGDQILHADDSRVRNGIIVRGVSTTCRLRMSGTSLAAPKAALAFVKSIEEDTPAT